MKISVKIFLMFDIDETKFSKHSFRANEKLPPIRPMTNKAVVSPITNTALRNTFDTQKNKWFLVFFFFLSALNPTTLIIFTFILTYER